MTTTTRAGGGAQADAQPARPELPLTDLTVCCAPESGSALSSEEAEQLAAVLKAVAEPTRLRLLSMVAASAGQEACVCDLTEPVGLSQPTISHHMKVLVDAGLLEREKRGVWAYYRLVPERLGAVAAALSPPA
ncbi:ArsR/SmtB family transcription factor [Actinotalea fermentans]|uniref:Putative transcriptional regulator, ArsR family protein n=1 Tax=Actinotalea fermentans TaxID=43671 RepID=A0A511YUN5_9CELL|nr:metalloregulator ArsR/SmtB family transcription factor [Actinotalea fermentans]KGM17449.1 ArsR family transcriptional regulator [Actinotalea fermentans ATCC 43279 = JCM 9966 = DSM 3133]GEN78908.1 putative transcriptional regulator, ArsR family protein [Actinotalea fermentans]